MDKEIFNVHTDINTCHCISGWTHTVREPTLKADSGRTIAWRSGNRTYLSFVPVRRSTSSATSPPQCNQSLIPPLPPVHILLQLPLGRFAPNQSHFPSLFSSFSPSCLHSTHGVTLTMHTDPDVQAVGISLLPAPSLFSFISLQVISPPLLFPPLSPSLPLAPVSLTASHTMILMPRLLTFLSPPLLSPPHPHHYISLHPPFLLLPIFIPPSCSHSIHGVPLTIHVDPDVQAVGISFIFPLQ